MKTTKGKSLTIKALLRPELTQPGIHPIGKR
jgi:hypothetical protein